MPRGRSVVTLGRDWSVVGITAIVDDKKVPFAVIGGKPEKLPTHYIIPKDRFRKIKNQVRAICADYEELAKLARQLKKPNWAFDLEKYGVIIKEDGCLSISRWHTRKDLTRERIWQTLPEIKSAIRQQDHIIEEYLKKKSGMENGDEISPELSGLLKKLHVVQPYIEMRRELLIFAQRQMDLSIRRTIKGLELLLRAEGRDRENCHGVPEKLKRLTVFLNNSWPKPYREKIDQVIPLIKKAKRSAAKLQWDKTKLFLSSAKDILSSAFEISGRQSPLISLSEIGPIRILAEVDKRGLTDEVMAMTKKHLPDQYFKYQGWFRLNALLAVAQLIIAKKIISQEEILKLLN